MLVGLSRAHLGRLSEALDDFTDATAAARRNGDWFWLPRLLGHVGWVYRELGAFERAKAHDEEALKIAREHPVWGVEAEVLLGLSANDVRQGRADEASPLLHELQARARESMWLRWLSELRLAAASAEHCAARGDHDRAIEYAATLAHLARRLGALDYRCASARVRACVALERGQGLEAAAADLESGIASLGKTSCRSRCGSRRGSSRS